MLEVLVVLIGFSFWCLLLLRNERGSKAWLATCIAGLVAGIGFYRGLYLYSSLPLWVKAFAAQYISIIMMVSGLLLFVLGVVLHDSVPRRVLYWLWIPAIFFPCLTGIGISTSSLVNIKSGVIAAGLSAVYGVIVLILSVLPLFRLKSGLDAGLVPRCMGE